VRLAQQHRILLELKTLHRPDTSTTVGAPEAPSGAIPLALTLRQNCLIARVAKEHQSRFSGWLRETGAEQLVLAQPESFAPVGRPESASWLLATDRRGFPLPEYAQAEEAAAVTLVGPITDDVIQRGHEVLVGSGSTARILGFARSQRAARWVVSPADGAATCRVLHRRLFERTE
jgi:hypothetical protein